MVQGWQVVVDPGCEAKVGVREKGSMIEMLEKVVKTFFVQTEKLKKKDDADTMLVTSNYCYGYYVT